MCVLVRRFRISGTRRTVYMACEPTIMGNWQSHKMGHSGYETNSRLATPLTKWWGRIGTNRVPPMLTAIGIKGPYDEYYRLFRVWHAQLFNAAIRLIETAYPHLINHPEARRIDEEIVTYGEHWTENEIILPDTHPDVRAYREWLDSWDEQHAR